LWSVVRGIIPCDGPSERRSVGILKSEMNRVPPPFRIVFFDNDGTLTANRSTWEYTHKFLGTWDRGKPLLDEHLANRTPYDEFARASTKLWKGFHREKFIERIRTIEIRPGVGDVVAYLKERKILVAVVSSGFSLWREVWKERTDIDWDYYYANDLIFDENDLCTGEIDMQVTDNVPGLNKANWVERICAEPLNIPHEERIFVGDGYGDIPGFEACAFGVAIDPSTEDVRNRADLVLRGEEFPKLLEIFSV